MLKIQNQICAGKIFKCTIFVGYGGVIFFTGVAPSLGYGGVIFFTGVAPDGSKVRRVYDVARKR